MARRLVRPVAVLLLVILVSVPAGYHFFPACFRFFKLWVTKPVLPEVRYLFLLVTVDGPLEWVNNHQASVCWEDKVMPLPVVFRVSGFQDNFKMGASLDSNEWCLKIGRFKVPITISPPAKFTVSNEGGFGMVSEPGGKSNVVPFSFGSWATVGPPEQPAHMNPTGGIEELEAAEKTISSRIAGLIAAGRVIKVELSR